MKIRRITELRESLPDDFYREWLELRISISDRDNNVSATSVQYVSKALLDNTRVRDAMMRHEFDRVVKLWNDEHS